ncbi:MAG: aryl-sulfate sulfotransferase [Thermoplasmata archaeon]|nr:MAG: aryl-sulfate sulfotransferase [Thermoplasmata archaeon]UCG64751.1 MAG: aryl-sulfate sulfotransferase [Deltaproteobacteria bacterium]
MGWSPFRLTGLTYKDSRSSGGYTLIASIGGDAVYLLDETGRVVHIWKVPGFQPGYGYILPGGNLLVRGQPLIETGVGVGEPAGSADILLELDWESKEIWRWESKVFHHDMCRLPNGNTLVLVWELVPENLIPRIKGGLTPEMVEWFNSEPDFRSMVLQGMGVGGRPRLQGMLTDAVWEIDPAGKQVHIWHAYDHLDPETDRICPLCFPGEWSHANAVQASPDGRKVLLSFRELSLVMIISWPDGDIKWKWGRPFISHQHDPTFTSDENVLIFDNGTHHPVQGKTRIVEVSTKTNEVIWQYLPSPVFSLLSGHIGGCERLANGNTLICEGESGRILEVTSEGEICWEWNSPFVFDFKGVKNVQIFRAHRYEADWPELKGRGTLDPGEFKEFNKKWGLD